MVGKNFKLDSLPDEYVSFGYKFTIGKNYKVLALDGNNVIVTSDDGTNVSIGLRRFKN